MREKQLNQEIRTKREEGVCVCEREGKIRSRKGHRNSEVSIPDELSQFGCPVNLSLWPVVSLVGHKRHTQPADGTGQLKMSVPSRLPRSARGQKYTNTVAMR